MQIGDRYVSSYKNTLKNAEVEIIELRNVFKCDMVIFRYISPENLSEGWKHFTIPYFNEIFIPK